MLQIAPDEGRGRYFAIKSILFAVGNAGTAFLMGRQLDAQTAAGTPLTGYLVIYGFCVVGSLVDLALMLFGCEEPQPRHAQYQAQGPDSPPCGTGASGRCSSTRR